MQPELSIVIPAYREGAALAESLQTIIDKARASCDSLELVVVDDGSPDDTWSTLAHLAEKIPELRAYRLSRNFGKEAALAAGISYSAGRAVIVMDADLQHPPELIAEMLRLWREEGYEIVNAVKRERGMERQSKAILARLYYRMFSRLAKLDLARASDFKLLDRTVADNFLDLPERNTFFRGLVAWMGCRQTSIPFDVPPRRTGSSRWSFGKLSLLAIDSILSFSALPMHLITALGAVLAAVSSIFGASAVWQWVTGQAVPGFPTVILLQIFFSAILMIAVGIIGAYIAKIYDEVKGRPRYLVHEEVTGAHHREPPGGIDRTGR